MGLWLFGGMAVSMLAAVLAARLGSGGERKPTWRPPRGITDPPRVCDTHAPECDCEACRVGY